MAPVNVDLKGNVNTLVKQIESGVGSVAGQMAIGKAVIINATKKPVNFYVYNYIDTAYWISAMHALAASGKVAVVSASGTSFKVHPDDNKNYEFLVSPGHAYVYNGPGDVDEVKKSKK